MFESREAVREAEMSTTVSAPAPGSKDDGSTTMSKAPDQPMVEASVASEDEDRLPTFREIVDLIIHPVVLRSFAIVLVATVILVGLRVLTWNEIADGARSRYVKTAIFGGASAMMVWFLVLLQVGAQKRWPVYCAVAVMLAGDAVHYVRLANPIVRGGPVVAFNATFASAIPLDGQWEVETANGGTAKVDGSTAVLTAGPSGSSYILARLPKEPDHITYPDEMKQAKGYEIQTQVTLDGKMHDWEIIRNPREIRLRVDGNEIWKSRSQGPLGQLKVGESKRDAAHGGTIKVERASYRTVLMREGAV
ncbi:MAG: hypothetical protein EBU21_14075 [Proteobacteria bacterium]|nr:hypothetical protein [Pseudomonadota bacterium]